MASIPPPVLPSPSPPPSPSVGERKSPEPFEPYTDDPNAMDNGGILLQQRRMMEGM